MLQWVGNTGKNVRERKIRRVVRKCGATGAAKKLTDKHKSVINIVKRENESWMSWKKLLLGDFTLLVFFVCCCIHQDFHFCFFLHYWKVLAFFHFWFRLFFDSCCCLFASPLELAIRLSSAAALRVSSQHTAAAKRKHFFYEFILSI